MIQFASMWYGSMTRLERLSINSFVKNGHTYNLFLYDDINAKGLPKEVVLHDANTIIPEKEIFKDIFKNDYLQFSDVFRIKMMKKYGYAWADLDTVCLSSETNLGSSFLPTMPKKDHELTDKKSLNNSIFLIDKDSNIMDGLIRKIEEFSPIKAESEYSLGPNLFTEFFISNQDTYKAMKSYIYPSNIFYPIHYEDVEDMYKKDKLFLCNFLTKKSFAVHLWRNSLKRKKSSISGIPLIESMPEDGSWLDKIYQKYLPYSNELEWDTI